MYPRILLACALLLAACSGGALLQSPDIQRVNAKTGEVETASATQQIEAGLLKSFPDIPIPATHKVDLNRSMIFTSANQTVGKITTQGKGDVASIYAFFTQQMQTGGWTLVNSFQSATSNLHFAKPGRFVAIIIEPTGSTTSRATINIGPE